MELGSITTALALQVSTPARQIATNGTTATCLSGCGCEGCLGSKVTLSSEGLARSATSPEEGAPAAEEASGQATALTESEQAEVADLKQQDQAVRRHEQAHIAASGGLAIGGASYGFTRGPDGQSYAVSGEVSIRLSKGRSPEETLSIARAARAAALAPADPSPQDRAVAAAASQLEAEARREQYQAASSPPVSGNGRVLTAEEINRFYLPEPNPRGNRVQVQA